MTDIVTLTIIRWIASRVNIGKIGSIFDHIVLGVIKSDGSGDRYLSFLPITIPIPIREAALLEPTWSWHFPVSTNNQTILVFLESHNDERFQFPRHQ